MKKLYILISLLINTLCLHAQQSVDVLYMQGIGGSSTGQVTTNVIPTYDGGFIVTLQINSVAGVGNYDTVCAPCGPGIIFVKYNAAGVQQWCKCGGGLFLFPLKDGGFVYGTTFTGGGGFNIYKLDSQANIVWNRAYSQGNGPALSDMIATEDGGFIMFGDVYDIDTNFTIHYGGAFTEDMGLIKVDSNGNKLWSKVIGGSDDDYAYNLIKAPLGGCYIFGVTVSNDYDCTGNHGGQDGYVARLDSNGNILWHKCIGGSNDDCRDYIGNIISDGKGGILIGTLTNSNDGDVHHYLSPNSDMWALNIDSSGNIVWENCYGGNALGESIAKSTDGSLWIAGSSVQKTNEVDTAYGSGDAWFVHTDSVGNFIDAKVLGTIKSDVATMIYPLSGGGVIAGGQYDTAAINGQPMPTNWYGGFSDVFITTLASWPLSVNNELLTANNVEVYPNPAKEQFNVKIQSQTSGNCIVRITDIMGKQVYQNNITNRITTVQAGNWAKGIYFVQAISGSYSYSGKVIIE